MRTPAVVAALSFAALVSVCASASASPSACPANFVGGQAPDLVNARLAPRTQALCFSEFGLLHSGLTRTPLWSADHLTAERVARARQQRRTDAAATFHEETALPSGDRGTLEAYSRSGYDRGHMSPNGDMDNAVAQGESFTLANMIPQDPENNRGVWAHIEEITRGMAQQYDEVWVVTMPIFDTKTQFLRNQVGIPAQIAKAVYIPSINAAAAYFIDNAPGSEWQVISVAELRTASGIDPFPAVSESVKQKAFQLPAPTERGHSGEHAEAVPADRRSRHPTESAWSIGTGALSLARKFLTH